MSPHVVLPDGSVNPKAKNASERQITVVERINEDFSTLTLDEAIAAIYQKHSSVENISTRPNLVFWF